MNLEQQIEETQRETELKCHEMREEPSNPYKQFQYHCIWVELQQYQEVIR